MAQAPTQNLQPGMSGSAVTQLQQWLIEQGYSIPDGATGYFGSQTKAALAKYQSDKGINTQGNPGYYGPITRQYVSGGTQAPRTLSATTTDYGNQGQVISRNTTSTPSPVNQTSGNAIQGVDTSNLNPEQQAMLGQVQTYLDQLYAQGGSLNPNVQITPEKMQEFVTQATNEISPYYASQLKLASDAFMQNLGYNTQQLQANEKQIQQQYAQNVRDLASNAADQGFAQSGLRAQQEQNLASTTQAQLDMARNALSNSAYNSAAQFAQTYGSDALNKIPTPTLSATPHAFAGEQQFYTPPTGNQSLYTLSPSVYNGLTGSEQFNQQAYIQNRASQLEGAFRTQQATPVPRTLSF